MGKILVVGLLTLFIILIFLETGGHIEQPFWPPFKERDLVKLGEETAVDLLRAPQGYNEGQIEDTIAVLQPEETGTIKQGGDISSACSYVELRWWCRVEISTHRFGWTEAWRLKEVNG